MTKWTRPLGLLALAGGLGVATVGCAEERAPINRVQPNALAKSFFVGADLASPEDDPEFYSRATVIDVGYGDTNGFYTSGNAMTVARIKWEITEKHLLGRLTYELINDADGHGAQTTNNGVVIASFPITSHFDIRRAYNSTTGEESNVVEENSSDRVWWEREYFRVDWSANEMTNAYDFDWLSFSGILNGVDYQSLHYYTSDDSEDAPVFDPVTGYFDITNRVWAAPKVIDTPYGTFPACFFNPEFAGGTYPTGSCNPTEVKIRLSFKRVVDNDYEPKDWTGTRFSMYGAFYEERRGYEDHYGILDASWHRFGSFYNIWKKTHADGLPCNTPETTPAGLSPNRDGDPSSGRMPDGTEDECEDQGAPAGSYCDIFNRECTLPLSQREVRAIPWTVGPDEPPELFEWTAKATAEWDVAVRSGVQSGRLVECRRTAGASIGAGDAEACDAAFPMDDESVKKAVPEIIFLCHNPVEEGDRPECGAVGTKARRGDLRYNFVNSISTPQNGSPWGVMLDGVDPLTGEKVQSSINLWDSVTKIAAQSAVDVMRWINGELDEESIKSGAYINQFAVTGDLQPKSFSQYQTLTADEVTRRVASVAKPIEGTTSDPSKVKAMGQKQFAELGSAAYEKLYGAPVDDAPLIAARLQAARESTLETELTTRPFLEISGIDPATPVDEATLEYASPLRGANLELSRALTELRDKTMAERGGCVVEAPEPTSFVGMARIMKEKFPIKVDESGASIETEQESFERVTKMREYMRKRMHYGVILHEMGHSIGLRHNFVGSFDSFNFRPQYWQLRTRNGELTAECADGATDGSSCVGPRWNDPMTPEEDEGLLWMWQHTTVMDYAGDISQDTLGLGNYDRAAARFFYGDALSVWNTPEQSCASRNPDGTCSDPVAFALQGMVGNYGGIGGQWVFVGDYQFTSARHYSQFGKEFQLLRNCHPSTKTAPADWNEAVDGVWSPVFDGQVVLGTECERPPEDFIAYRDLDSVQTEAATPGTSGVVGGKGRVRWPHMFATDYSADIGNVAVLRHDNGADAYEQFNYLINMYENRHIFDNFRRGRQSWSVRGSMGRSMSRFSDKMRNIVQAFALYHDFYLRGLSLETGADYITPYESTDGVLKPLALASTLAFDHFTRQLTRPPPGEFFVEKDLDGVRVARSSESTLTGGLTSMILPEGSQIFEQGPSFGARRLNNSLSNADGAFDVQWLTSAGSYYDKAYATYHLTESSNRFLDVSYLDFYDGRYRNLSFVNVLPDGFRRLVGGALTGDIATTGPRVGSISGNTPETDPKTKWPRQGIGWPSFWPDVPEACWATGGRSVCRDFTTDDTLDNDAPAKAIAIDPAIGFEVQKFIVFNTLLYLPENWRMNWVDQLRIYSVGSDNLPDLPGENSYHWKDPEGGTLYIARRYGSEDIFGKTVEKGIAARMLAWANKLTEAAYEVESIDPVTGKVNVVTVNGVPVLKGGKTQCEDSPECMAVRNYKSLLDFTRQTASTFGFPAPEPIGITFN